MPKSVLFSLSMEFALIVMTTLLLAQPAFLFKTTGKTFQTRAFQVGGVVLVFLFGWSVALGRLLANYEIVVRY